MQETAPVISDEKQATAPTAGARRRLVTAIAVAMSLYHMYVAGFGPPEAMIFRGTHLLFALTLVFLLYPSRRGGGLGWPAVGAVPLAPGGGVGVPTRRVIGWALPLTALAFLVYAIGFTNVTMQGLMEQVYLSLEGIFGSTLGVSASYVMLFVLFGAFMERSGTGQLSMDLAR